MTHQAFNEYSFWGEWWDDDWNKRWYALRTSKPFIIKLKHIVYTMFINKSILPNLGTIVNRFNMNKHDIYIMQFMNILKHYNIHVLKKLEFIRFKFDQ